MGRRINCYLPRRIRARERYWILRQLGYPITIAKKDCPNPWRFEQRLKEIGLEPVDGYRLTKVSESDSYTRWKHGEWSSPSTST